MYKYHKINPFTEIKIKIITCLGITHTMAYTKHSLPTQFQILHWRQAERRIVFIFLSAQPAALQQWLLRRRSLLHLLIIACGESALELDILRQRSASFSPVLHPNGDTVTYSFMSIQYQWSACFFMKQRSIHGLRFRPNFPFFGIDIGSRTARVLVIKVRMNVSSKPPFSFAKIG